MLKQKEILDEISKKSKLTKLTEVKKFPTAKINVPMPKVKLPKDPDPDKKKEK